MTQSFNQMAIEQAEDELEDVNERIEEAERVHKKLMEPLYGLRDGIKSRIEYRKGLLDN